MGRLYCQPVLRQPVNKKPSSQRACRKVVGLNGNRICDPGDLATETAFYALLRHKSGLSSVESFTGSGLQKMELAAGEQRRSRRISLPIRPLLELSKYLDLEYEPDRRTALVLSGSPTVNTTREKRFRFLSEV
jgi:hypothetical protein